MIDEHDLWLKWWILIDLGITQSGEMDAWYQSRRQSSRFAINCGRILYKRAALRDEKGLLILGRTP